MNDQSKIANCDPESLSPARTMAHMAAQHLTGLARANLEAKADDSHSNLGWDAGRGALVTHDLQGWKMGLQLATMTLFLVEGSGQQKELRLAGKTVEESAAWTDENAKAVGLKPASDVKIPYELPGDFAQIEAYQLAGIEDQLAALAQWFDASADALENVRASLEHHRPGPSPVRCWPHHFDIATYVALEDGDPETARGIGIGMAPGDSSYDQPYLYVNPWPHLSTDSLGNAPEPGHWHTDGFVGLIATGNQILEAGDPSKVIPAFLDGAVATALNAQGLG